MDTTMKEKILTLIKTDMLWLKEKRRLWADEEGPIDWASVRETDGQVQGEISAAYALGLISDEEMSSLVEKQVDILTGWTGFEEED